MKTFQLFLLKKTQRVYLRKKPDVEVQVVVLWSDLNAVAVDLQPKAEAGHPRHQASRVQVHNDPNCIGLCLQPYRI